MSSVHNSREFPGVPIPENPFPPNASIWVDQDDSNTVTVQVATAPPDTTPRQPIDTFTSDKKIIWSYAANTMGSTLTALANLSKYLETEVQTLNKPKWAANITALAQILDQALQQSTKLCDDTTASLSSPTPTPAPSGSR